MLGGACRRSNVLVVRLRLGFLLVMAAYLSTTVILSGLPGLLLLFQAVLRFQIEV